MNKIIQEIEEFLSAKKENNRAICVVQGNRKLSKKNATKRKFLFTLSEINSLYGGVSNLLQSLPKKGFTNGTTLQLRRFYGNENITSHLLEELTLNFDEDMNNGNNNYQPPMTQQTVVPSMGYPQGMSVPQDEWVTTRIKADRYNELERELKRYQDELSDARSKLRIAEEKNNSLQLQLDVAEARKEIEIEKALLAKKGFLESPAGQKLSEAVAMAAPHIISAMSSGGAVPALGNPNTEGLSQVKQHFINVVSQDFVTDEIVQSFLGQLENMLNQNENNNG